MSRLFLLFSLLHFSSFAQLTEKEEKRIVQILGDGFVQGMTQKEYPFTYFCDACTADTSLSMLNDTLGLIYNNEYILYRHPISYMKNKESLKLIRTESVSVAEYQAFQLYVRDSIAREKLYNGLEYDKEAAKFLDLRNSIEESDEENKEVSPFDPSKRDFNRSIYPLNWKQKFSYSDLQNRPILNDMYFPWVESYYRIKDFDQRKLVYRYYELFEMGIIPQGERVPIKINRKGIPTISHNYFWSRYSTSYLDKLGFLGHFYSMYFKAEPIIGLNAVQADAFCHWKAENLQKELDQQGLNVTVLVTLPSKEDLILLHQPKEQFQFPELNLTKKWQITVEEYTDFIEKVRDSILLEKLYYSVNNYEDAAKLIDHKDLYYYSDYVERINFDPSLLELNRGLFNLKNEPKIIKKYSDQVAKIKQDKEYINPSFTWIEKDVSSMAVLGEFKIDPCNYNRESCNPKKYILVSLNEREEPLGFDLNLGNYDQLGKSSGVRSHENYSRFFKTHVVPLTVQTTQSSDPNSLMQDLTYEQAQAYYFFKNPIYKATEKSDWTNYIFPTEEQFKRIQSGETVILPQENLAFPSPVFRYVVHVFPKSQN